MTAGPIQPVVAGYGDPRQAGQRLEGSAITGASIVTFLSSEDGILHGGAVLTQQLLPRPSAPAEPGPPGEVVGATEAAAAPDRGSTRGPLV